MAERETEVATAGAGFVLRCPRCGGEVTHDSDAMGYGATIEQCEHVLRCGYSRTLEKARIPAHTRAPKTEERRKARAPRGPLDRPRARRGLSETARRILAVLPTTVDEAIDAPTVNRRLGSAGGRAVDVWLSANRSTMPVLGAVNDRPGGRRGRYRYWRIA